MSARWSAVLAPLLLVAACGEPAPSVEGLAPGGPDVVLHGAIAGDGETTAETRAAFTDVTPPETCPVADCGPPLKAPQFECWDGSIGGNTGVCLKDEAGQCGWEFRECPPEPECKVDEDCRVGLVCEANACEQVFCTRQYDPVCGVDGTTYGNPCEARVAHADVAYKGVCQKGCYSHEACAEDSICTAETECHSDPSCPECDVCWGTCEVCPVNIQPVCGADGVTYGSECLATRARTRVVSQGACPAGGVCPAVYDPVCGVDGKTYGNTCEAKSAGVDVSYEGPCLEGCYGHGDCDKDEICTAETECGSDPGCPECDICWGTCETCPVNVWPVCGADGITYGSECLATRAGTRVVHQGPCGVACRADAHCDVGSICRSGTCVVGACPKVYRPVCGADRVTYGNACEASLAHVEVVWPAACPSR
ncbi:MAG: hypothetical protein H6732_03960 [Alphaproteobacteria bacterium]|nr:hypothetical protein [Alphaproteobacteria bacterium]